MYQATAENKSNKNSKAQDSGLQSQDSVFDGFGYFGQNKNKEDIYYSDPVNYEDESYPENYPNNKQFAGFMGVSTTYRHYYLSFLFKTKLHKHLRDTGYHIK